METVEVPREYLQALEVRVSGGETRIGFARAERIIQEHDRITEGEPQESPGDSPISLT